MEENGLGKQFFPLLYLMTVSYFKNKQGFEKNSSISIGGWATFFYKVMSKGFDNAIRDFRGSHDDDEIAKNEFVTLITNLYTNKGLEILQNTHLDKKSCYVTDKAIQIEEIKRAIKNYNSFLTYRSLQDLIKKLGLKKINEEEMDDEELKKAGEKLNELKYFLDISKDSYLREISKYLEKNFYLKNLMDYGKSGNRVFLDKFGRLELDIYLPKKGYVKLGNRKIEAEPLFKNAVELDIGENSYNKITIVDPYYLTIMKLDAKREKDIKDLIGLYNCLFELSEVQRRHYKLKNPIEYLKELPKEYKEIFLEELKNNKLYKNKDETAVKIVDILKNH